MILKQHRNRPGDVHSNIFQAGGGEHTKQLVEDGGEELHHHMSLHGVQTLIERGNCDLGTEQTPAGLKHPSGQTSRLQMQLPFPEGG